MNSSANDSALHGAGGQRRPSASSLASASYDMAGTGTEAAATAAAGPISRAGAGTPTPMGENGMNANHTGSSMLSARVMQSRYFGSGVTSTASVLNGGNNLTSLSSLHLLPSTEVASSPMDTAAATAASTMIGSTDKTNDNNNDRDNRHHELNVKYTLKHLDLDEINDSNDYSFDTTGKSRLDATSAPMQQPTLTGSTNNSFSSTWISNPAAQQQQQQQQQQQHQLLLQQQNQNLNQTQQPHNMTPNMQNLTPWIEQQAQLSQTFHHFNGGAISSHSTGNDPNNNFATNLSMLTTNSLLSNPMSQLSQQQQLRQPQYMKINSISPPNTNENNVAMNTNFNPTHSFPLNLSSSTSNNNNNNNNSKSPAHNSRATPTYATNVNNSNSKANNNSVNTTNTTANNTSTTAGGGDDDELIPTAIVIKNIPFAIKKEQLLEIMSKLNLPLPYAFNYHFDNGVFRGLAFANFNSIEETSMVVNTMNGREIDGRKLRVEYKKMLPVQERERIEREKKEKRCQLEEQHRSSSVTSLTSLYSTASAPPSTSMNNNPTLNTLTQLNVNHSAQNLVSTLNDNMGPVSVNPETNQNVISFPNAEDLPPLPKDVDFNNKEILEFYTMLILFKEASKSPNNLQTELCVSYSSLPDALKRQVKSMCAFLDLSDMVESNILIIKSVDSSQLKSSNDGVEISFAPSIGINPTSASNFAPSLIRSQSHNLINPNPSLLVNAGRYRQQSPRTVSQNQQYQYNNPQTTMGLTMNNMNNMNSMNSMNNTNNTSNMNANGMGMSLNNNNITASNMNNNMGLNLGTASLQQLQQQQQHQSRNLHHSSSAASLNLLRNKGLTAPTTPITARQSTFTTNNGLPNLYSSNMNNVQQSHGLVSQTSGYNYPQITGGSNISMSTNKGLDELYSGMEYLSFDNTGNPQN